MIGFQLRFFIFSVFVFCRVDAASPKTQIEKTRAEVKKLRQQIDDLKTSVKSLETIKNRLNQEMAVGEVEFRGRFEAILVPLLNWPTVPVSTRVPSWVEHQHLDVILMDVRQRIVQEPLHMISDRELKIQEADRMRGEFSANLRNLETKESLYALQLEELQMLEKRALRKARAATKRQQQEGSPVETQKESTTL